MKEIDIPKIARTSDFSSDESVDLNANIESLKVKYLSYNDSDQECWFLKDLGIEIQKN